MRTATALTLALACLLPLAACSKANDAAHTADRQTSMLGDKIRAGMEKAKKELETKNIDVSHVHVNVKNGGHGTSVYSDDGDNGLPKAEISPQGDFLIEGRKIAATPAQQALLLDYRSQVIGIAEAGMDIGANAADLGINAAKEAIFGAISGKSDKEIEASIKPQTDRIEAAAAQLCSRLPGLQRAQQQLAAALPEFKPYATMTQKDIDDCGKDDDRAAADAADAKRTTKASEPTRQ
jgi:hypothetical protein